LTDLFLAPIWILGLIALLRDGPGRFLGYTYLILIGLMIASHGEHYYPGDVYPIVIAAGSVVVERWTQGLRSVRIVLIPAMMAAGFFFLPFALPVLSEQRMFAYTRWVTAVLALDRSTLATERHQYAALPNDWADMHGWPELAKTVARIYDTLPLQQRRQAAIVASNYGEAAAIDFFGAAYGLPPALSGHNNYWLWGTHGYSGDVVIDVNGDCGASEHLFTSSRLAARFNPPWVISYEQNIPIMVCAGIRQPLATIWPKLKSYL
jgi:hypothetical protein